MKQPPERASWSWMRQQCSNPLCPSYSSYGALGIKVCERWEKFPNFLEDMGRKPDGMVLTRNDKSKDFCKENCKWVYRDDLKEPYKGTPTHNSWAAMKQRCNYESSISYKLYGAAGITVCERWKSYKNFLADMGERPKGKTLDRIDGSKGYEPSNCRWATPREQRLNQSSRLNYLTLNGETLLLSEWALKLNINATTLHNRIYKFGWSIERAFHTSTTRGRNKGGRYEGRVCN